MEPGTPYHRRASEADVETTKTLSERHIEAEDICQNKNANSGGTRYMLLL